MKCIRLYTDRCLMAVVEIEAIIVIIIAAYPSWTLTLRLISSIIGCCVHCYKTKAFKKILTKYMLLSSHAQGTSCFLRWVRNLDDELHALIAGKSIKKNEWCTWFRFSKCYYFWAYNWCTPPPRSFPKFLCILLTRKQMLCVYCSGNQSL